MEENLKKHRDLKNAMDSQKKLGFEEGIEKGIEKGIERTAIGFFKKGIAIPIISELTELSEDDLLKLFRREGLI